MDEWPKCKICDSSSRPAFIAGDHKMYSCLACHTAFVDPTPSNEYLTDFYSKFHMSLLEGGEYELVEDRMKADFPAKVELVKRYLPEYGQKRLLDVGCGKGYFVKHCREVGIDAQGVDLSTSAIEFATSKLRVPAMQGTLGNTMDKLGKFDVVTFWATIEHVQDPLDTLNDIFKVLHPGGLLFLDTGVGNDWLDRMLPGHVQWYDPPQHLFVFSEAGMRIALEKTGYNKVNINTNFERSRRRGIIKKIRNNTCATALRLASTGLNHKSDSFAFTRFPLGNLMSIVARRQ